jgi:signal transduction histidine kinase
VATGQATVSETAPVPASGQDLRVIIHDLRNMLAVIVNYCELIAEETADPEAVRTDLNEIKVAAERALALTDKLPRPPKPPTVEETPTSAP